MSLRTVRYVKAEDRWEDDQKAGGQKALDLSPMLGTWINTNGATRGIWKVVLGAPDGALIVRAFAVVDPSDGRGEVKAGCIYSDTIRSVKGTAFVARYDIGDVEAQLQVNLSLGLLIVASFERSKNGGRASFAREFFRRQVNGEVVSSTQVAAETDPQGHAEAGRPDTALEATPFSGVWLNTNDATAGIARVIMAAESGSLTVRVIGAGDSSTCDWGEVEAEIFADSIGAYGEVTFMASYDFGFMETHLHAWIKLGVLVIAKFDRFKDGSGRSNHFSREFFYRVRSLDD